MSEQHDQQQARIRELEAQLNAAILARREAQQAEQAAIEARNRAGVEIRRPLMERIRELEQDAARYRKLRLGQYWSVISGDCEELRLEALDADIDAAMAAQKGGE